MAGIALDPGMAKLQELMEKYDIRDPVYQALENALSVMGANKKGPPPSPPE